MELAQLRKTEAYQRLSLNDRFRAEKALQRSSQNTGSFRDYEWWRQFKEIIDPYATDVTVTPSNAIGIGAYVRGVRLRAQGMASMSLKLYKVTSKGKVVATDHPIYKLLKNPGPEHTGFTFRRWVAAQCVGRGNGYAPIIRDSNYRPIQLIPLPDPDKVTPFYHNNQLYYAVSHPGVPNVIPATEMLHFKGLEWDNPLCGVSPIRIHKESLGTTISANRYASKTYQTGRIMGIISSSLNLNKEQQMLLRDSFEDVINGEAATTVIPGGGKFEQLSLNPVDADYIQYSNLSVEDINRMLNVPDKLVTEEEQQAFYTNTLLPDCINFEQELDRKLLREDEQGIYYFKHIFQSLLRSNTAGRADFYLKAINGGFMSPNQIAELEDLAIFEGGDQHFAQSNLVPIDKFGEWIDSKITANTSKSDPNPEGVNQDETTLS